MTFPQGGSIITVGTIDAVKIATANFYANVTDPKASILTTLNWDLGIVNVNVPPLCMCLRAHCADCNRAEPVLRRADAAERHIRRDPGDSFPNQRHQHPLIPLSRSFSAK